MASIYDKIDSGLKEIRRIQNLIQQGLAKPSEKEEAFRLAKEVSSLFTNDIFKRKTEKLSKITIYSNQTRDGFVSPNEATQLNDWIALLEEYKDGRKVKTDLSSEKVHIHSVVDGEDQNIFITEKCSDKHTHLIIDGGTGEIRIDPKDQAPHDLIKSIEARLELQTGETIQVTKSSLSFIEPVNPQADVKVYSAIKDDYFVLEIYNSGDEDLEDFRITVSWEQSEGTQERVLSQFNEISDYLVKSSPKSLNMLRVGEKVLAINIPSHSSDKKIKVTVACKGMKSDKVIEKVFEFETPN